MVRVGDWNEISCPVSGNEMYMNSPSSGMGAQEYPWFSLKKDRPGLIVQLRIDDEKVVTIGDWIDLGYDEGCGCCQYMREEMVTHWRLIEVEDVE